MDVSPPPLQTLQSAKQATSGISASGSNASISSTAEVEIPSTSAMSTVFNCKKCTTITRRKKVKNEKQSSDPQFQDSSSSSSTSRSFSKVSLSRFPVERRGIRFFATRRNPKVVSGLRRREPGYLKALALPLGMSIAAIVAQILERKDAAKDKILADQLSQICASAIRESLVNVFGEQFDSFVGNFEKSFRCTLMTLQVINKSTKRSGGRKIELAGGKYSSEGAATASCSRFNSSANDFGRKEYLSETLSHASSRDEEITDHVDIQEDSGTNLRNWDENITDHDGIREDTGTDLRDQQLMLYDRQIMQQLALVSPSSGVFNSSNNQAILSTLERSVMEQARSNDLKTFEMGLTMRKIQLKERQLELSSYSNFLERYKLSLGFSKASFKFEKFKIQLEDARHADLLKRCIDCLVSGLFIMFASVGYGIYVYSHHRIAELTAACTRTVESNSWWMPKPMSSFNSGMQILKCHFQVLIRLLAGGIMVIAIAYLLLQRSASSNQTMPVTSLVLLLGIMCGVSGKLCIDTLGGDGYCWLYLWWTFCLIHTFSNVFTPTLFAILNGPVTVSETMKTYSYFPYCFRRFLFYATSALFLPLLCGFLPFASLLEWQDHFFSLFMRHQITTED